MTGNIGLGLILNILFWTVAVLVAVGLAALGVIEWFPGREPGTRATPGASRDANHAAEPPGEASTDEDEAGERYRKVS